MSQGCPDPAVQRPFDFVALIGGATAVLVAGVGRYAGRTSHLADNTEDDARETTPVPGIVLERR